MKTTISKQKKLWTMQQRIKFRKRKTFWEKVKRYFQPHYSLHVTHRGENLVLVVKSFQKKSPKLISGYTATGKWFELKSDTPMDYYIRQLED